MSSPSLSKKYMYDLIGNVTSVTQMNAQVTFCLDGTETKAFLQNYKFYHSGKFLCKTDNLNKCLSERVKVKFSCYMMNDGKWIISHCWKLNENKISKDTEVLTGLIQVVGQVQEFDNKSGIIAMNGPVGITHKVQFSRDVIHKGEGSSKSPKNLEIGQTVYFDAVPCEDANDCSWIATCVFTGKRPSSLSYDKLMDSTRDRLALQTVTSDKRLPNRSANLLLGIERCIRNPREVFVKGKGVILKIVNDEYGVALGQFVSNVFQTILFHRKYAYLFKAQLTNSKLTEIFVEGDHIKFIAIKAPMDFITEWIAVQISVSFPC